MDRNDLNKGSQYILHDGVISRVSENAIGIRLKGDINCTDCKAKAACGVSDSNNKEIEIKQQDLDVSPDEDVIVIMKRNLGLKAVFWAYLLPFILMIIVLIIASSFTTEWISGVLALLILIPYYYILYVSRDSFQRTYTISILKST